MGSIPLQRRVIGFPGPNAHRLVYVHDEYLAVIVLPCSRRSEDRIKDLADPFIRQKELNLDLRTHVLVIAAKTSYF